MEEVSYVRAVFSVINLPYRSAFDVVGAVGLLWPGLFVLLPGVLEDSFCTEGGPLFIPATVISLVLSARAVKGTVVDNEKGRLNTCEQGVDCMQTDLHKRASIDHSRVGVRQLCFFCSAKAKGQQ